jgi:hypothetical protein
MMTNSKAASRAVDHNNELIMKISSPAALLMHKGKKLPWPRSYL